MSSIESNFVSRVYDIIRWYCKNKESAKYKNLYQFKGTGVTTYYDKIELPNGDVKNISDFDENNLPKNCKYLLY